MGASIHFSQEYNKRTGWGGGAGEKVVTGVEGTLRVAICILKSCVRVSLARFMFGHCGAAVRWLVLCGMAI